MTTGGGEAALIGYTGFVGGNLSAQRPFDALYNSSNIDDIAGRAFDLIVCAGARAEKWKANADPERDLANIESLPAAVTIPAEAVIDSGLRKTVFVARGNGVFEPRSVQTGR